MKRRSMAEATIVGHLAKALEEGYFVDYRRGTHLFHCLCIYIYTCACCSAGLTEELEETITSAIRKEPIFSSETTVSVRLGISFSSGLYRYLIDQADQRPVTRASGL